MRGKKIHLLWNRGLPAIMRGGKRRLGALLISMSEFVSLRLPLQDTLVLECESDMDDNPRAFYEYLLTVGWNRKHRIVWLVSNPSFFMKYYRKKNVVFINRRESHAFSRIRLNYYLSTAKYFVFSHPYWFVKRRKNQIIVNVWHGTPIKAASNVSPNFVSSFDYICVPTEESKEVYEKGLCCPQEKMVVCGPPRLDLLKKQDKNTVFSKLFAWNAEEKVVVCLPTYRQSSAHQDSVLEDRFTLEVIQSKEDFQRVDSFLHSNKMHLIIKPHPLQLREGLSTENGMNIHYIDNQLMLEKKIQLYELIGCCDGLLTDISSVYFDFLLLNRPIGLLTRDKDRYQRGLIDIKTLHTLPGENVDSLESLFIFLRNVATGKDYLAKERAYISKLFNRSIDIPYSEELARFLFHDGIIPGNQIDQA